MRFVAVPILILLVLSQSFSNCFLVAAFKLNQEYIAKNLCVNRYRPELKCHGKCFLMQKMREIEKEEQNKATPKWDLPVLAYSSKTFFSNTLSPVTVTSVITEADNRFTKPVDRSLSFFQPPRA
jgi:hypothetical protein